jgi:hypothetical protein
LAKKGAATRAGLAGTAGKAEKQSAFGQSRPPIRRRRARTGVKKEKTFSLRRVCVIIAACVAGSNLAMSRADK